MIPVVLGVLQDLAQRPARTKKRFSKKIKYKMEVSLVFVLVCTQPNKEPVRPVAVAMQLNLVAPEEPPLPRPYPRTPFQSPAKNNSCVISYL